MHTFPCSASIFDSSPSWFAKVGSWIRYHWEQNILRVGKVSISFQNWKKLPSEIQYFILALILPFYINAGLPFTRMDWLFSSNQIGMWAIVTFSKCVIRFWGGSLSLTYLRSILLGVVSYLVWLELPDHLFRRSCDNKPCETS